MVKQRYFVAEEVIAEVLSQHRSLISLYRVGAFLGEDWEVFCFSWGPFLLPPRLFCGFGELK